MDDYYAEIMATMPNPAIRTRSFLWIAAAAGALTLLFLPFAFFGVWAVLLVILFGFTAFAYLTAALIVHVTKSNETEDEDE